MYSKRIKIFVILAASVVLLYVLRLAQMQVLSGSFYHDQITRLKLQRGRSRQLGTIRGKILDRNGRVLATDEPRFQLCVNYSLTSLLDGRVYPTEPPDRLIDRLHDLRQVVEKSARFKGVEPNLIERDIEIINDSIWNWRAFQAWRTRFPDSEIIRASGSILAVKFEDAIADFRKKETDPIRRNSLINKADILEMHRDYRLLDLETDDDVFTAQLEFLEVNDVVISPKAQRRYPYGSVAAHAIGWVGLASQPSDTELFKGDKLAAYLPGEVCGREDGAEFVCETVLRGRRGERVHDIDRKLVKETRTQFGKDVALTLDIELQQRIEQYITDSSLNPDYYDAPTAAVVIDVSSADILALVSLPVFDLNRARYDYDALLADPDRPFLNRAIDKQYPPGSVIKPLILVAGLESAQITPGEIISCPARKAPRHWPSCWIFNRFRIGHDDWWDNNARNAIRGSCNCYFSRLADRISSLTLQRWLYDFGYGHEILSPPAHLLGPNNAHRNFRQAPGQISSAPDPNAGKYFDKIPDIAAGEKRFFGIGQGNLRVTPLQVANAMAALARRGLYKRPRLLLPDPNYSEPDPVRLPVSEQTLNVVYDGMSAVISEHRGTAHAQFSQSGLDEQGVKVYGKTGSTEQPDNAWFGGFAIDNKGRSIALAVVVEGGQHGSSEAAPIARDTIQFCIEAGYLGQTSY